MKVLTLWQPWASLVSLGVKTIETRSWSTKLRGRIAIHAAARPSDTEADYRFDIRLHEHGMCFTSLPLGAIVATAVLADCAPIGGPYSFRTGIVQGDEGDFPGRTVVVKGHDFNGNDTLVMDLDCVTDISNQLPYGDFAPGRWAWLLADIEPLAKPVPFKGGQGLTKEWTP